MKKKKLIICTLGLVFSFLFTGCAEVYDLSAEDEDTIAVYCAKTVSKFSTSKKQGYVNLVSSSSDEDELEEEEETVEELPEETEETTEETKEPEETEDTSEEETQETVEEPEEPTASASMTDALAISGLSFNYKNSVEMSYYSMGGYYDITPQSGNDFLVVTYDVVNSTDSDIVVDIPSSGIVFKASVGGAANTADNTILLNDLSVFSGTVEAGTTEELVLLFQFKPENLSDLSSLKLQMVQGDTTTNIEL
ncbi:MAG: hypothetical protein K5675_00705 [Lachnospiraceae bacterium]|nr:hypothetical protein [Lachnospiraceae bacterium]